MGCDREAKRLPIVDGLESRPPVPIGDDPVPKCTTLNPMAAGDNEDPRIRLNLTFLSSVALRIADHSECGKPVLWRPVPRQELVEVAGPVIVDAGEHVPLSLSVPSPEARKPTLCLRTPLDSPRPRSGRQTLRLLGAPQSR